MNSYEEKKQRRIDYYNEKAEKFEQQSSQLAHESSKMVEAIPLGQPLLVDHYSYKSDKNYRDRAWGKMEKSVEPGQKADYYRGSSGPQDGESDHVGIVEKVENGTVYTVEGNSGDSCRENHYAVGYYEIMGYGVPQY